jgi:hypothetical protein
MSKHAHLQSVAEQISDTGHGSAPFHYKQTHDQTSKSIKPTHVATKMLVDDSATKLLAYQIHQEKGGSELDNWFEAERIFNNNFKEEN